MHFSRKSLSIPYIIFLVAFVILPLFVVLYYAFTNGEGEFTIANFTAFFTGTNTLGTLLYSTMIAISVTVVCLLMAYPVAYILVKSQIRKKSVILMLFVLPMWINFTLRITALKEILTAFEGNLAFHPFLNSVIGMTYDFLPFMILPIYNSLEKIDKSMYEAAQDLGASNRHVFVKVILPLSLPGIVSGITMVFLPSMTNYVVLDMFYNSTYIMGSLIGSYFSAYDWNNGSMISLVLLLIIILITLITKHFDNDTDQEKEVTM